jgi:hypothetical protein
MIGSSPHEVLAMAHLPTGTVTFLFTDEDAISYALEGAPPDEAE